MPPRESLEAYRRKRDFRVTPEPKGASGAARQRGLRFVIQKHAASRLHYDFRLELEGTLKSWAVPKGPSLDPRRKSLAVQVEDHPIDYGEFEGVIPKGEYGAGTVLLWDRGTWEPLHDPVRDYKAGKLHFVLHGQKLHGEWTLVRMHGASGGKEGENWLLIKGPDRFASPERNILDEEPKSVKSRPAPSPNRAEPNGARVGRGRRIPESNGAGASPIPGTFSPQLAVLSDRPPEGDDWLHEVKFDGYRLIAFIQSGKVRLSTRRGLDWTARFPALAGALSRLDTDAAIVDGEVVVLDPAGRSDFQALQATMKNEARSTPVLFAFDLPFCDGADLRNEPLIRRKERLEKLLKRSHLAPRIEYSGHVRGHAEQVLETACQMSLEGIISKKADSPYVSRRDPTWLKSKCVNRQEFVIIGFTDPQGGRTGFGSLLLGYHDDQKRLVYAGRVGTGFDARRLRGLRAELETLEQDDPPTDREPPLRERREAHWVRPTLVAEVRFRDWTRDGVLRQPAFVALRSDKPPASIVRERPVEPEKLGPFAHAPTHNGRRSPPSARAPKNEARLLHRVRLTHPTKVLYPDERLTKQEVAQYYEAVGEWALPYMADRPLAFVRCPSGVAGKCFFQRNWTETMPADIDKVEVGNGRTREQHVAVHDIRGILSTVQMDVLEIHSWNCTISDVEHPDQLVFDLDPGPGVTWSQVLGGARELHRTLESLKLPSFPKTSGGKGLHLTIPIEPNIDWSTAKSFCRTIASALAQRSDLFVANMRKDLRGGKIFLDYERNDRGAMAVAPYSVRARGRAAVSMPVSWQDLGRLRSADQFTLRNAPAHCRERTADPWADFESSRVDLRQVIPRAAEN
jgi:bifunctional non-homologous end joining protein LigD